MLNFKENVRLQRENFVQFRKKVDGNTSIMFAVSLSTLLLGIGVAIDLTSIFSTKSKIQDSLDAAVLAAAISANEDNYIAIGQNAYSLNMPEGPLANTKITFEKQNLNNENKVVGTVSGSLPLFFSGVLKKSVLDISVQSTVNIPSD